MSEKRDVETIEHVSQDLKLDSKGLPLRPQPSEDPHDPLNWPFPLKVFILIQVSILAALGTLNTAIINPAYVPLAKEFNTNTVIVSYQTTVVIAINGLGPFLWIPLANVYGRRPVYITSTCLGFASALGSGFSKSFGQLLVARVFNGFFPAAMSLGAATVTDIFFLHQRGRAMGVFAVLLTTGAHTAPIIGGLVGEFLGWRWCFYMGAILTGSMLIVIIFFLPETLYIRNGKTASSGKPASISFVVRRVPGRALHFQQFFIPSLRLAKYPSVIFPAIYYAFAYGFGSILPAVTVATIFTKNFHFNTLAIGLAYGGALTIGAFVGELGGGMVVDAIVKRERKRQGASAEPEASLKAIWTGEFLVPAGLLMYGFGIQFKAPFMVPIVAMGIAMAGVQVITTVCYTYAIDCYESEASEISQLFNLVRQEVGFTFAFFAIPLGNAIGYQYLFLLFALVGSLVAFAPIVLLMLRGKAIRMKLGQPTSLDLYTEREDCVGKA